MLVATAGVVAPASAPGAGSDAFARRVAESTSVASEPELERRAYELAHMRGALQAYFELASAGCVPGDDGEALPLGEDQLRLLRRVAELFAPAGVIDHVRNGMAAAPGEPWRRTALALLGLHGGSSQFSLLSQLVCDGREAPPRPGLVEPFTEALTAVLRRDGVRVQDLRWLAVEAPMLVEAMIPAVGRAGRPEGLDWLTGFLNDPRFGAAALREIGRLAGAARGERAAETAAAVLPVLLAPSQTRRRSALRVLSALQQPASLPRLVLHLERAPTESEREMTLSALRAISRVNLPADAAAWADWARREKQWFSEFAEGALARLAAEDVAEVVAAVHELARHPLHRERFATPLAALLAEHASPVLRAQVCLALSQLGSEAAVPQLLAALEDDDPSVRASALRALRTLTGLSAGSSRQEWEEALDARASSDSRQPPL
ncbi:MAG TPA: HEAT repeat domain-containing protein [Planctomycetota bacterium]